MPSRVGRPVSTLDTPALLIDLDVLDANLRRMQEGCRRHGKALRVHFKSLKCGGLAAYLRDRGVVAFLCAKVNEAEVLADRGVKDIFVANQIVAPAKLGRLAALTRQARVLVAADDVDNVRELSRAAVTHGVEFGVLVEVNIGMNRCGVEPGRPAVELANLIASMPGLTFAGLQGYDGHLQGRKDFAEKERLCVEGLDKLEDTKRLLAESKLPTPLVTGAGTGTWEYAARHSALTELQPGSFLLMDAAYAEVRPEFSPSLSVLAAVVSRRPGYYVLDAGSKAISQDFGVPKIAGRDGEAVQYLAEEHTKVNTSGPLPALGEHRRVRSAHCCATMNLHREVIAVRGEVVEAVWAVEASGRYD